MRRLHLDRRGFTDDGRDIRDSAWIRVMIYILSPVSTSDAVVVCGFLAAGGGRGGCVAVLAAEAVSARNELVTQGIVEWVLV